MRLWCADTIYDQGSWLSTDLLTHDATSTEAWCMSTVRQACDDCTLACNRLLHLLQLLAQPLTTGSALCLQVTTKGAGLVPPACRVLPLQHRQPGAAVVLRRTK